MLLFVRDLQPLADAGALDLADLKELTDEEMTQIGMTRIQVKRLRRNVEEQLG